MTKDFAEEWIPVLDSILNEFIQAFDGKIDRQFWNAMVSGSSESSSGETNYYLNGWINSFFPFIPILPMNSPWWNDRKESGIHNGRCRVWSTEEWLKERKEEQRIESANRNGTCIDLEEKRIPSADLLSLHVSSAFVEMNGNERMELRSGFIGGMQIEENGNVKAKIRWAIIKRRQLTEEENQRIWRIYYEELGFPLWQHLKEHVKNETEMNLE